MDNKYTCDVFPFTHTLCFPLITHYFHRYLLVPSMRHTRSEELGKQTKATALSSACSQAGGGEGPVNSEVEQMRCVQTINAGEGVNKREPSCNADGNVN